MGLSNFASKSFVVRTLSGALLLALILATGIPGGRWILAFSFLISIFGIYELYSALSLEKRALGIVGYAAVVVYYIMLLFGKEDYIVPFLAAFFIVLLAVFVFNFQKYKTTDVSNALMCMIYAGIMPSFLYMVRTGDNGLYVYWLIFLASWGCDTCAYLAGMAFGKHKMAPVLSPKKSIEGAVGGVIGAALLGAIYGAIFRNHLDFGIHPAVAFAIICAVGAVISMIGDLAASAIKRDRGIKDYGNIIPGHGGVMDRFDSVCYVAPVIFILLQFIN